MKLSVKHQIFITIGLAVIILIGFVLIVYRPQAQKLGSLEEERQKKEAEVKSAKATVDRLEDAKNELSKVEAKIKQFSAKVPVTEDFSTLLKEVQRLANESGVRFVSFKTAPLVGQSQYAELPLDITVDGYYRDLVDFLWRVNTLTREVKITSVEISEGEKKLPHIQIDIKANAFVFKNVPKQQGQGQPGATEKNSQGTPPS